MIVTIQFWMMILSLRNHPVLDVFSHPVLDDDNLSLRNHPVLDDFSHPVWMMIFS